MLQLNRAEPADRRLRILCVSPASPWPPDSGGAQRTALLLEALDKTARIDLCLLGKPSPARPDEPAARYELIRLPELPISRLRRIALALLDRIAPELALMLPNRDRAMQLAKRIGERGYDAVVIRYSATACQLRDLPRLAPGTRWIVDVDDFIAQLLTSGQGGSGRDRLRRILMSLARPAATHIERHALQQADGLWVTGWRPQWLPDRKDEIVELPNIPWYGLPEHRAPVADGAAVDLIGVAQFGYAPNREGFDWFIREVWPRVRASRPDARLKLAGNPPPGPDLDLWRSAPGVELTGKVPDVTGHYASARVAIAPIFRGGGSKIKVLEALAMGLPCVCSTHAASALPGLDSLMVTDDPATFAQNCLRLLEDANRRADLAERGAREVGQSHSRSMFGDRVSALVRHVVQQKPDV